MAAAATAKAWSAEGDNSLAIGNLGELLGFHLRLAQTAMYRDFAAAMSTVDLTQKQCATLSLISSNPGVPQIALASRLGTDRATMMAIVDRLENRGLVLRQRSTTDRRRQELYITPLGVSLLAESKRIIAKHEDGFTSRMTAKELETVLSVLRRIHGQG